MGNYYLQAWYIRVASRVVGRLGARGIGKCQGVSRPHGMMAGRPVPGRNGGLAGAGGEPLGGGGQDLPAVRYFTWELGLAPDTLWAIVAS